MSVTFPNWVSTPYDRAAKHRSLVDNYLMCTQPNIPMAFGRNFGNSKHYEGKKGEKHPMSLTEFATNVKLVRYHRRHKSRNQLLSFHFELLSGHISSKWEELTHLPERNNIENRRIRISSKSNQQGNKTSPYAIFLSRSRLFTFNRLPSEGSFPLHIFIDGRAGMHRVSHL